MTESIRTDACQRLLPDEGTFAPSSLSGRTPITMKLYVTYCTCFLWYPRLSTIFICRTPRTLMIQLRSRDTKMARTRSTSVLKHLCHRTSSLETPGSIGRPHYHQLSWPPRCLIFQKFNATFTLRFLNISTDNHGRVVLYDTFYYYATAWGSADLQCFKFPLSVCVFNSLDSLPGDGIYCICCMNA